MDLIDRVREVSLRAQKRLDKIETEEGTKTALVMPFISHVLGYNVFDPGEVVPEFTADVGTKKGEKVDYAILQDDTPVIIFECKKYGTALDKDHASQLYRYFSVTQARFGVLTDGIAYRFFADLEEPNKMDSRPFFELDLLNFNETEVEELRRFTKTSFDLDQILSTAKDLKYIRETKKLLAREWSDPSEDFARYVAGQVYDGTRTRPVIEQFLRVTKKACQQFLAERVDDRLKSALQSGADQEDAPERSEQEAEPEGKDTSGIVTTEDEMQGYLVVKAILSQDISAARVAIRDTKSYCGVLLDDTNRKPICRLFFNSEQKYLGLVNEDRSIERLPIESVDGIYHHADRLRETVQRYEMA